MKSWETFLKNHKFEFDVDSLMSDDLKKLDEVIPPTSLFKYVPKGRNEFFARPMVRFTQRQGLNDPFELMKRWAEFASGPIRSALTDHVVNGIRSLVADKGLLLEVYKEQMAKNGVFLSPREVAEASLKLLNPSNRSAFDAAAETTMQGIASLTTQQLDAMGAVSDQALSEVTQNLGILSLTDNSHSRVMWSLYASAGEGYLIEFKSDHSFFKAPNGRNLVWPVSYRDEFRGGYFENPAAIFLTKHAEYSFEREWRMILPISEAHEVITRGGHEMHMWHLPPGVIRSITFGYNYNRESFPMEAAFIRTLFDSNIEIRLAFVDRSTGNFDYVKLEISENESADK